MSDYVRTNNGDIGIIINCPEELKKDYGNWLWFETTDEQRPIRNEHIIKSSPNIIDLIEVGDYVNGSYIQEIEEIKNNEMTCMLDSDYEFYSHIKNEDIKSIVTKEQFEAMQYKIGE